MTSHIWREKKWLTKLVLPVPRFFHGIGLGLRFFGLFFATRSTILG